MSIDYKLCTAYTDSPYCFISELSKILEKLQDENLELKEEIKKLKSIKLDL